MKEVKIYLITTLLCLLIGFLVIVMQISNEKKVLEEFFQNKQQGTAYKLLNNGVTTYSEDNEKTQELCKQSFGRALSDEEMKMQMSAFLSQLSDGINTSNYSFEEGMDILIVEGAFAYYDKDKNCINLSNTLLLSDVYKVDDTNIRLYRTFSDDSLTEEMNKLLTEFHDNFDACQLRIDGAYIKDTGFVPDSISYCTNTNEWTDIYNAPKSREDMEADGYTYKDIHDKFSIGRISDSEGGTSYAMFIYGPMDKVSDEVHKLLSESRVDDIEGNSVFQRNKVSLFVNELFGANRVSSEDGSDVYYSAVYEKRNVIVEIILYGATGNHLFRNAIIYFLELFGSMIIGAVAGNIYIKKKVRISD